MQERGLKVYLGEFLGTLILVASIGMVISTQSAGGHPEFIVIAMLHLFMLAVLIASLGGLTGAHFNPAVTVTMAVLRKIRVNDAAFYIFFQLAGGIAGAYLVKLILLDEGKGSGYGSVGRGAMIDGHTSLAFLCEAIGTFILLWAIMAAAVNPAAPRGLAPIIIGSALAFGVMMFGPITGAGFNPARALGPAIAGDTFNGIGRWLVAFVAGPLVGGVAAGVGYEWLVLRPRGLAPGERPQDELP
jgi:glycerol uptake facilitator protein